MTIFMHISYLTVKHLTSHQISPHTP